MTKFEDNCSKCGKALQHWEYRTCTSCKEGFDKDQFKADIDKNAKEYASSFRNGENGSSSKPSTNKGGNPDNSPTDRRETREEYYQRIYGDDYGGL